jgi:hypothetical protein
MINYGEELVKFRKCVEAVLQLAESEASPYYCDVRFADLATAYKRIESALQQQEQSVER